MPEQTYETVPVDSIAEHPANPRRGNVAVIEESIERHGFYGAVVVQRSTRYVLAGNHRLRAAKARGLTEVPAIVLDVDDDTARRILLVDNRSSDLARYDEELLRVLLADLDGDYLGSGYDPDALGKLLDDLEEDAPDEFPTVDEEKSTDYRCPSCGYEWSGLSK
jgi:ParB-like chromosome segregation protein Spo0J